MPSFRTLAKSLVVTDLLFSTDLLQVVLSDLLFLVSNRFVAGCFNKSLRLCCEQLATDLFPQAYYRLTKPTYFNRPVRFLAVYESRFRGWYNFRFLEAGLGLIRVKIRVRTGIKLLVRIIIQKSKNRNIET
jgi:hypothetical protein